MGCTRAPVIGDFHVRTCAFIEQIVLLLDAVAEDFSERENIGSGDERR
jgi:hypothetical protein